MQKQKQRMFSIAKSHGGRRRGSGRKNLSGAVNHMARPIVNPQKPMMITMRIRLGLPSLRRDIILKDFASAIMAAKSFGLRVIHFILMGNHFHLLVEADCNLSLSRGMQSLAIRFAKLLKRYSGFKIKGSIFVGRYHVSVLKTPRATYFGLRYVLLNDSKQKNQQKHLSVFSSGLKFHNWPRLGLKFTAYEFTRTERFWRSIYPIDKVISSPVSWLLTKGYLMHQQVAGGH
jgi:REP element-mobilizing transposase RayT